MTIIDASDAPPRRVPGATIGVDLAAGLFAPLFPGFYDAVPVPEATTATRLTLEATDGSGRLTLQGTFPPAPADPLDLPPWRAEVGDVLVTRAILALAEPGVSPDPQVFEVRFDSPERADIFSSDLLSALLSGNDALIGSPLADTLQGAEGDDTLSGGKGADTLLGDAGDDRLLGQGGPDRLEGGEGADTIVGKAGDDTLFGGQGDDRLLGGSGDDLLVNGSESTTGTPGIDTLVGGSGDDTLRLEAPRPLPGGAGDGTCYARLEADGGKGTDTLQLDLPNQSDLIYAFIDGEIQAAFPLGMGSGEASVLCIAHVGVERIETPVATSGTFLAGWDTPQDIALGFDRGAGAPVATFADGTAHVLTPGAGGVAPRLMGFATGSGDDAVDFRKIPAGPALAIDSGAGDDTIRGGRGDDLASSGGGRDRLIGGGGTDSLGGGGGSDRIRGGGGRDDLSDGPGRDVLTGGGGADAFVLADDDTPDRVADFRPGEGDVLLIEGLDDIAALRIADTTNGGLTVTFQDDILFLDDPDGTLAAADAIPEWFGL